MKYTLLSVLYNLNADEWKVQV